MILLGLILLLVSILPDPRERPTLSVPEAGRLCGLAKSKSYEEAQRYLESGGTEGLPVLRFGRSLRVPTAAVLALLHLAPSDDAP